MESIDSTETKIKLENLEDKNGKTIKRNFDGYQDHNLKKRRHHEANLMNKKYK